MSIFMFALSLLCFIDACSDASCAVAHLQEPPGDDDPKEGSRGVASHVLLVLEFKCSGSARNKNQGGGPKHNRGKACRTYAGAA